MATDGSCEGARDDDESTEMSVVCPEAAMALFAVGLNVDG